METQYYINLFKALLKKLEKNGFSGVSAFNIALVLLQELSKDRRVEEMKKEKQRLQKEPATIKQIKLLYKLGKQIENELTKQEASKIIQEILTRKNGKR